MSKKSKLDGFSKLIPLDDAVFASWIDDAGNFVELYKSGRKRVFVDFSNDPGLTEQSHSPMTDITAIVNYHTRMGGIPPMPESTFVDLTQTLPYQEALNSVLQINSLFENLPLKARVAYDHNPALFMAAVEDPSQRDRLIELGIFNPKVEEPLASPAPGAQ